MAASIAILAPRYASIDFAEPRRFAGRVTYETASNPSNATGSKRQGPVGRQIVRHGCRDPHEGKACVGPFLQRRQPWQEQHDGSGQLPDAEQDTQLLGISHVPKVLDRLGGAWSDS